ncbi:Globin protein 26 [Trichostrongylus colubriformis]|uniref:Globin protein 26 n=1 Tax=Trichostrongylus colubriformis TaxID=6319 RepID=A0AAN8F7S9_TRICO
MGANQSTSSHTPLSARNSSSIRSKSCETQILNSYQKVILRATWRHMSKSGQSNCGSTIMRRLFIRNDRIKNVFHHNIMIGGLLKANCEEAHNVQEHYTDIVQFLEYVISNLDYPSKITEKCHEIGIKHRQYKAMGMKTEHWDLLGEAITETIREYQGWKRHRESLRAANILVSFLVDRIRNGFLQRDGSTPTGTPPTKRVHVTDRERSRSLQEADNGSIHYEWTDSCPSINTVSSYYLSRRQSTPIQKRSAPAVLSPRNAPLDSQLQFRRRLPETPLSDGEETDTSDSGRATEKRRHYRGKATKSFELGHFSKD